MNQAKLASLIQLDQDSSSLNRRAILREITEVFLVEPTYSAADVAQFDDVLCALAVEMEEAVRAQLAERFAKEPIAPKGLVRRLAFDVASVAAPVLEHSSVLSDDDLLDIVKALGQEHLRAVSLRVGLSESISDVIVDRGDAATLTILAGNETAALSRRASETLVERSSDAPDLQEALVRRKNIPPDLLNAMYFNVGAKLKSKILERNSSLNPEDLEAALAASQKSLAARHGALPADYVEAEAFVRDLRANNELTPQALVRMLRDGRRTQFILALADSTEISFDVAVRIIERRDLDALAILCKAADFDRALFTTFAMLIAGLEDGMARASEYGELYQALTKDTALRTLRFWRVVKKSAGV